MYVVAVTLCRLFETLLCKKVNTYIHTPVIGLYGYRLIPKKGKSSPLQRALEAYSFTDYNAKRVANSR